jgi:hypothetical protein
MQLSLRPIAVISVIGALSLLAAGCTAGGDTRPTPSASRSATAQADGSSTPGGSATAGDGAGSTPVESSDLPTSIAGSGQSGQPADPTPSSYPATAVVTYANWDTASRTLQVGGLVTGTSDTGGTCTFTAKSGTTTRTATSSATAGASSVSCAEATFPQSRLASGRWTVTLTYAVGSASTTSTPTTAEVP